MLFIDSLITQELPQRWIHFLDSDDYLKLDCLQKCLEAKDKKPNLEIINHKIDIFNQFSNSFIKVRNLESKKTYYESGLEYLVDNHFYMFCFVFRGMFSSSILNRYSLRFTNKIFHEDCDFGTILFALSNGVLIEDFRGLVYRQRKGSIMAGYAESSFPPSMPSNLEPLRPYFKNYKDLREYFRAYSFLIMAVNLMKFRNSYPLDESSRRLFQKIKRSYICNYIHNYSNLNILPAENLLRDLGITNLKRYRRIDIFFRPRTAARKILKNILKFLKKEG